MLKSKETFRDKICDIIKGNGKKIETFRGPCHQEKRDTWKWTLWTPWHKVTLFYSEESAEWMNHQHKCIRIHIGDDCVLSSEFYEEPK